MKTVFVALLMIAAASALPRELCKKESTHDLQDGLACSDVSAQKLVYKKELTADATLFPIPSVNTRELTIPNFGQLATPITCIMIVDRVLNDRGGCPSIADGGAGLNHVTLRFTSQRAKEMKFHIEIYTKA